MVVDRRFLIQRVTIGYGWKVAGHWLARYTLLDNEIVRQTKGWISYLYKRTSTPEGYSPDQLRITIWDSANRQLHFSRKREELNLTVYVCIHEGILKVSSILLKLNMRHRPIYQRIDLSFISEAPIIQTLHNRTWSLFTESRWQIWTVKLRLLFFG